MDIFQLNGLSGGARLVLAYAIWQAFVKGKESDTSSKADSQHLTTEEPEHTTKARRKNAKKITRVFDFFGSNTASQKSVSLQPGSWIEEELEERYGKYLGGVIDELFDLRYNTGVTDAISVRHVFVSQFTGCSLRTPYDPPEPTTLTFDDMLSSFPAEWFSYKSLSEILNWSEKRTREFFAQYREVKPKSYADLKNERISKSKSDALTSEEQKLIRERLKKRLALPKRPKAA